METGKQRCSICGAPIEWVNICGPGAVPVDVPAALYEPMPGGLFRFVAGGEIMRGDRAFRGEPGAISGYAVHWDSCNEKKIRR